ncbi:hypothetical protein [Asticcacaulis sp. EMRT-3]|uniref:hypothetical protein n=1 Tax=Asticcacaulis sp. EMRT-3 TaxID=3040349 RepID=UPI0024AF2E1F|nr:hypothetical protein [Asticcacaulis sp. EMRT-3]MDI7775838.1 hypothetical protein [Asticcacaulis sp. EMRT-3]
MSSAGFFMTGRFSPSERVAAGRTVKRWIIWLICLAIFAAKQKMQKSAQKDLHQTKP